VWEDIEMKSPVTDKTLGIAHDYDINRFSEVRARAKDEERELHKKSKRNKKIKLPKYEVRENVILSRTSHSQHIFYYLVEVIDFEETYNESFQYFAILKNTTDPKRVHRIGRLVTFTESGWFREITPANVPVDSIKNWKIADKCYENLDV
jgi:hypothetical protein